jgi:hypothetical protein
MQSTPRHRNFLKKSSASLAQAALVVASHPILQVVAAGTPQSELSGGTGGSPASTGLADAETAFPTTTTPAAPMLQDTPGLAPPNYNQLAGVTEDTLLVNTSPEPTPELQAANDNGIEIEELPTTCTLTESFGRFPEERRSGEPFAVATVNVSATDLSAMLCNNNLTPLAEPPLADGVLLQSLRAVSISRM